MSNANVSGWLPGMLGPVDLQANGSPWPSRRNIWNLIGSVTVRDVANPDDDSLSYTEIDLGNTTPGAGSAGTTVGPAGSTSTYVCDGVNDEVQINAAINAIAAAGGGVVELLAGSYFVSAMVTLKSNVVLRGASTGASKIYAANGFPTTPTNYYVVGAIGTETTNTPIAFTADTAFGATTIHVSTGAELNAVAVDTYLFLGTNAIWEPTNTSGRMSGEFVRVKSVDTVGGIITIHGMLRDAYRVADSASLYRMTFVENAGVEDLEILQQAALGTRASAPPLLSFMKARNVHVFRVRAHNSDGVGMSFHSVIGGKLTQCTITDLSDNTGANLFGYGVLLTGANEDCVVSHNHMSRVRHAFSTGSISAPSPGNILLRGVTRGTIVSSNVASHCTDTCFDSHAEAENISFIGNVAHNSQGLGFYSRARGTRFIGNTVEWTGGGIHAGANVFDGSSGQAAGTQIVGNTIRHCKGTAANGITLALTDLCLVKGNTIASLDGAGIELRMGTQRCIIDGNTIEDCNLLNQLNTLADAIYLEGGSAGSVASIAAAAGVVTLSGLTGMSSSMVGKTIVVSGATTGANNGSFVITSSPNANSVTYANAGGVADASNGAIAWYIESVCDNIIANNVARNTGATLTGHDSAGHIKYVVRVFAAGNGIHTNRRNVMRNNLGLAMETGLIFPGTGNFEYGNSNNEAYAPRQGTAAPADTDFSTTPSMGTLAVDTTTGFCYFRTQTANTWGNLIHARGATVSIPVATLQFASTVAAPAINQGSVGVGAGQSFIIAAQSTTAAGSNGGSLYLNAGNSGAGGADMSVRLGIGSGNTGIQITPTLTGQSLYSVALGPTSVLFNHATDNGAGVTAASWTLRAQNAGGSGSTGGQLILSSGSGVTAHGRVRIQVGSTDVMAFDVNQNVSFGAQVGNFAGGQRVIFMAEAVAIPTANPGSGGILWVAGGHLFYRGPTGAAIQLA